jgi:hypothetical protein
MQQFFAWETIYVAGAILLFAAIAWGFWRARRRTPREKAVTEAATKELYEHPERYEERTREQLKEIAGGERERSE